MLVRGDRRCVSWLHKESRRVADELSAAASGAKIVSHARVIGFVLGGRRINRHATDGVPRERTCGLGQTRRQMLLVFHEGSDKPSYHGKVK